MGKAVSWAAGLTVLTALTAACGGCQSRRAAPAPEPAPAATAVRLAPPETSSATGRPLAEAHAAPAAPATEAHLPAPPLASPPRSLQPPTGRPCRVIFRRDALGSASPAPLGVQSPSPASRAAELTGTIDQISDDWLVLRARGRLWWLPRSVILAIDFPDAP